MSQNSNDVTTLLRAGAVITSMTDTPAKWMTYDAAAELLLRHEQGLIDLLDQNWAVTKGLIETLLGHQIEPSSTVLGRVVVV